MKDVCRDIASGNWPKEVRKRISEAHWKKLGAPSDDLKTVAKIFVSLQQNRHAADYDTVARFQREATLVLVNEAGTLIETWDKIPAGEQRTFFLFLLAIPAG